MEEIFAFALGILCTTYLWHKAEKWHRYRYDQLDIANKRLQLIIAKRYPPL